MTNPEIKQRELPIFSSTVRLNVQASITQGDASVIWCPASRVYVTLFGCQPVCPERGESPPLNINPGPFKTVTCRLCLTETLQRYLSLSVSTSLCQSVFARASTV